VANSMTDPEIVAASDRIHDATPPAGPDGAEGQSTVDVGRVFEIAFPLEVDDIVAAGRLAQARTYRLFSVVGVSSIVVGVFLAWSFANHLVSALLAGVPLIAAGCYFLAYGSPYVDRWRARRGAARMLGTVAHVRMDAAGLTFARPKLQGHLEWSNTLSIRENARVTLFVSDRMPFGWIPASAFRTPAERAEFVSFARAQIARFGPPL
jgi:hypothetical protein